MSNAAQSNAAPRQRGNAHARRVLVVAHSPAGESLPARLSAAGYDVRAARAGQAAQALTEFAPHVALVEVDGGRGRTGLEFAARLRAERATAALPLVLLFEREDADLRAQAVSLGADDYFALATPPAEIAARLDALFWRVEAGRRAASLAALERRAEIDSFLQLFEAVRDDIDEGAAGAIALVAAAVSAPGEATATAEATRLNQTLAAAHDFLLFNLRRVDSVAFYGPTLLLVYVPQKSADAAHRDLARLLEEFQATREGHGVSLDIGLASFPSDGTEIEILIEQAEAAILRTPTPHAVETRADFPAERPADKPSSMGAPAAAATPSAAAAPSAAHNSGAPRPDASERNARADFSPSRAVRESKQTDMETSMMPAGGAGGAGLGQGALAQAAADAAARERELRTRGALMPRRLLLTISDPARMAQTNLLLRSAGYEVRAAFDGLQAINLLRIERPDLLVIEDALNGIDGLEALRRLHRQHHERLPLPVVLLLSNAPERERVRAEAERLGARGFVAVPYDPEELLTCVRTVGITD